MLDLYAYAKRDAAGGAVSYKHHIVKGMSAFATGYAEWARATGVDYGAQAGFSWEF